MEQAIKLNKRQYLKQLATPKVKKKAVTTVVLTFLCIIALLLGLYLSFTTPVDELPVISLVLDLTGARSEFNTLKTELTDAAAGIDMILSQADDSVPEAVVAYMQELSTFAKGLASGITLQNLREFMDLYARVPAELMGVLDAEVLATAEMAVAIVEAVFAGIAIAMLIPALLTTLGGFCRVTFLVVLGMLLSIPITAALYMGPLFLLCLLTHILLIVFLVQVNKAYKVYKRAPMAPPEPVEPAPIAE